MPHTGRLIRTKRLGRESLGRHLHGCRSRWNPDRDLVDAAVIGKRDIGMLDLATIQFDHARIASASPNCNFVGGRAVTIPDLETVPIIRNGGGQPEVISAELETP